MDYNAITLDRFDRAVKKLLAIKNGGILGTLSPELQAGVDLTPADNELMASLGYIPFARGYYVAAVAGQYSKVEVVNLTTAASPWLVVVTAMTATAGGASASWLGIQSGAGGRALTVGSLVNRDTRQWGVAGLVPVTVATLNYGNEAATSVYATQLAAPYMPSAVPVQCPSLPVYLGPLSSLLWEQNTVNLTMYVSVAGYARQLDPGELVP